MDKTAKDAPESQNSAEILALQAVLWLATDPQALGAFLNDTGAAPDMLATHLKQPAFLAAVLDFILAEDQRVIDFAATQAIHPEMVVRLRAYLPGGDLPNWT